MAATSFDVSLLLAALVIFMFFLLSHSHVRHLVHLEGTATVNDWGDWVRMIAGSPNLPCTFTGGVLMATTRSPIFTSLGVDSKLSQRQQRDYCRN